MPNALQIAGHALGAPGETPADAIRLFAAAGLDADELIWQDEHRSGIPESNDDAVLGLHDRDRPYSTSSVATVTGDVDEEYAGAISLEHECRWHPQDLPEPPDGFRAGAEHLRELYRGETDHARSEEHV